MWAAQGSPQDKRGEDPAKETQLSTSAAMARCGMCKLIAAECTYEWYMINPFENTEWFQLWHALTIWSLLLSPCLGMWQGQPKDLTLVSETPEYVSSTFKKFWTWLPRLAETDMAGYETWLRSFCSDQIEDGKVSILLCSPDLTDCVGYRRVSHEAILSKVFGYLQDSLRVLKKAAFSF